MADKVLQASEWLGRKDPGQLLFKGPGLPPPASAGLMQRQGEDTFTENVVCIRGPDTAMRKHEIMSQECTAGGPQKGDFFYWKSGKGLKKNIPATLKLPTQKMEFHHMEAG